MTDELTVQAVNPQVKRKDNTMPYTLGGAAVGAAAGGLSPIGVTKQKYSSYEDILKESKDTFETNINKGGDNKSFWETAKQHKEAVDKAGEEWEAKVKEIKESHKSAAGALPADHEVAKNLKTAQEAYDNEFKKLVEAEEKSLSKSVNAQASVIPTDNTNLTGKQRKEYNKLRKEYKQQLDTIRKSSEYQSLSQFHTQLKDSLKTYFDAITNNFKSSGKKAEEYFVVENPATKGKSSVYNNIRANIVEPLLDAKGSFKDKTSKAYKTRAHEVTAEIVGQIKEYAIAKEKLDKYSATFKVSKSDLGNAKAANIAEIMSNSAEYYDKTRTSLKEGKIKKKNLQRLMSKYGCTTETELKNVLGNRYRIARNYEAGCNTLKEQMNQAIKKNTFLNDILKERTKLIESNKSLKEARNAIVNAFPDLFAKPSSLSADEIKTKAEEAAKKSIEGKKVVTDLEAAKKAAEEEAKKLGLTARELTDDELAKILKDKGLAATKDEACTKAKTAAKEALEKDLSKIKGPNRLVNAAIAGLVLAGVGYGIASSKKN